MPARELQPAFSPDGTHVAFAWDGEGRDNLDLYVKVVGDVTPLRLTSDPAVDGYPAWSPDGRQIAFYSARGGGGIYLISPLGGQERKLADLATDSRPVWLTDGKFLLVARLHQEGQPDADDGALFLVPVESERAPRRILTPARGTWYRDPALAPDGRSLAFASCTAFQISPKCSLQVAEWQAGTASAGTPREIAIPFGPMYGAAWTTDGASLIYGARNRETSAYLWR